MTNPNRGRGGFVNGRGAAPHNQTYSDVTQQGPRQFAESEQAATESDSQANNDWKQTNNTNTRGGFRGRGFRGNRGGRGFQRGFRGRGRGAFPTPLAS